MEYQRRNGNVALRSMCVDAVCGWIDPGWIFWGSFISFPFRNSFLASSQFNLFTTHHHHRLPSVNQWVSSSVRQPLNGGDSFPTNSQCFTWWWLEISIPNEYNISFRNLKPSYVYIRIRYGIASYRMNGISTHISWGKKSNFFNQNFIWITFGKN